MHEDYLQVFLDNLQVYNTIDEIILKNLKKEDNLSFIYLVRNDMDVNEHGVFNITVRHYVIKFVSDFLQVSGFLRFPPPIKLAATI
jgi:aspartyl/asparaginyl-tRNA synthetase